MISLLLSVKQLNTIFELPSSFRVKDIEWKTFTDTAECFKCGQLVIESTFVLADSTK